MIDAGLHQSNSKYDDFLVNKRRFKEFKPKDIDYIFVDHSHQDHLGIIPRLYKEGCSAKIIVAENNKQIMYRMLQDSAFIIDRDVELINNQHGKNYEPLYTIDDVETSIRHMSEYPVMEKVVVDETLAFKLIPNGHLPGSVQVLLYLKQKHFLLQEILEILKYIIIMSISLLLLVMQILLSGNQLMAIAQI